MDRSELGRFKHLNSVFEEAKCVCDPIEFQRRQQMLLYAVCEHILHDYHKEIDETIKPLDYEKLKAFMGIKE